MKLARISAKENQSMCHEYLRKLSFCLNKCCCNYAGTAIIGEFSTYSDEFILRKRGKKRVATRLFVRTLFKYYRLAKHDARIAFLMVFYCNWSILKHIDSENLFQLHEALPKDDSMDFALLRRKERGVIETISDATANEIERVHLERRMSVGGVSLII